MKLNNKGFMMAEVVVVSSIILIFMTVMFTSYNKMFSIYPNNHLTYFLNGLTILQKNKINELDKAIDSFKKAKELDKLNTIAIYSIHIGLCYQKMNNWQQAELYYTNQLSITPKDIKCYLLRAHVRQKLGKYLLADEDLKKINMLNPYDLVNKINRFVNSLQMIDYYKALSLLLEFYDFIKERQKYNEYYLLILRRCDL